jgi:hypothetical protein
MTSQESKTMHYFSWMSVGAALGASLVTCGLLWKRVRTIETRTTRMEFHLLNRIHQCETNLEPLLASTSVCPPFPPPPLPPSLPPIPPTLSPPVTYSDDSDSNISDDSNDSDSSINSENNNNTNNNNNNNNSNNEEEEELGNYFPTSTTTTTTDDMDEDINNILF